MKRICGLLNCLLLVMICTFSLADARIDEATFPDKSFRECVKTYDTDGDGILSDGELTAVTYMSVGAKKIKSLKGIEYFISLEGLNCADNFLKELALGSLSGLKDLACADNDLKKLDISGNTELTTLGCWANMQLKKLDVSNNTKLVSLNCFGTKISKLDVSNCPALYTLVRTGRREGEDESSSFILEGSEAKLYASWDLTVKAGNFKSYPVSRDYSGQRAYSFVTIQNGNYYTGGKTAIFVGMNDKNAKKLEILDRIPQSNHDSRRPGIVYKKVTEITDGACKNMKNLQVLTLGKNLKMIGKEAFNGCRKLNNITIQGSGLKSVGDGAFRNIYKKPTFIVPKKKMDNYKKMLLNAGAPVKSVFTE